MKRTKTLLSLLLVFVMVLSTAPQVNFAHYDDNEMENVEDFTTHYDETEQEERVLIYNLGTQEVAVNLSTTEENYTLFLEDDAFFPYEVQFKYDGRVWTEWFYTPDSVINIDGVTFDVYSRRTNPNRLSQLGMWINGEFIHAYPDAKEFTDGGVTPFSLLPLETHANLNMNFSDMLGGADWGSVSLAWLLDNIPDSGRANPEAVYVAYRGFRSSTGAANANSWNVSDSFRFADGNGMLDLREAIQSDNFTLEVIVGSRNQLDPNNVRYVIRVSVPAHPVQNFSVYGYIDGTREFLETSDSWGIMTATGARVLYAYPIVPDFTPPATFYLRIASENLSIPTGHTYRIFEGILDSPTDTAGHTDVTDVLASPTGLTISNANWTVNRDFTIVVRDSDGTLTDFRSFRTIIYAQWESSTWGIRSVSQNVGTPLVTRSISASSTQVDGFWIDTRARRLPSGYSSNAQYHVNLDYTVSNRQGESHVNANDRIIYAVEGFYRNVREVRVAVEANAALNIKDELFGDSGYRANYQDGVIFTVVAEREDGRFSIMQVSVMLVSDDDIGDEEIISAPDAAWFNLQRFERNGTRIPVYDVGSNVDTYASYGTLHTFLVHDTDVDLSRIVPVFTIPMRAAITATPLFGPNAGVPLPEPPVSGQTEIDFSHGAVQFTVAARDGINVVHHIVEVVQRQATADLFVAGPVDNENEPRIMLMTDSGALTPYHDIFIANIGDVPLTGLNAQLNSLNAEILIDPYWTVGSGTENNLQPFTTVDRGFSYGELPNVAKIRIIPNLDGEGNLVADGYVSEGVNASLVISSANGGSHTVYLLGVAGPTTFLTETVDVGPRVKFVPYQAILQPRNLLTRFYRAEFSIVNVEGLTGLPEGLELLPNGFLEGVPKEAGEFTFRVEMNVIRLPGAPPNFPETTWMTRNFTLTIEDNEQMAVWEASDEDFQVVLDAANPRQLTPSHLGTIPHILAEGFTFTSFGEFGLFESVFIDGEELNPDTDYDYDPGSTVLTLHSNTFTRFGTGERTIAMSFRDSENRLTRTAQNYNLISVQVRSGSSSPGTSTPGTSNPGSSNTGTSSGGFSTSGGSSRSGGIIRGGIRNTTGNVTADDAPSTTPVNNQPSTTFMQQPIDVSVRVRASGRPYVFDREIPAGVVIRPPAQISVSLAVSQSTITNSTNRFVDVISGRWYEELVAWAFQEHLMVGTSDNTFSPSLETTTGMVAVTLGRIFGADLDSFEAEGDNNWYAPAYRWLDGKNILDDLSYGEFDKPIERGRLAVIINKLIEQMNLNIVTTREIIVFADENQMSTDEKTAFDSLNRLNIMHGMGEGYMSPRSNLTRAELTALLFKIAVFVDNALEQEAAAIS